MKWSRQTTVKVVHADYWKSESKRVIQQHWQTHRQNFQFLKTWVQVRDTKSCNRRDKVQNMGTSLWHGAAAGQNYTGMILVSEQPQLSVNGPTLHGQMCSKLV